MKKPALKSATPNDAESNALFDDAGHDLLTERFTDPSLANRVLAVVVLRTTEAGGHDDNGDRVTKYRVDHIEVAQNDAQEKKMADLLTTIHKGRTQNSSVAALTDPVEDEPLDGVDEIPDVES